MSICGRERDGLFRAPVPIFHIFMCFFFFLFCFFWGRSKLSKASGIQRVEFDLTYFDGCQKPRSDFIEYGPVMNFQSESWLLAVKRIYAWLVPPCIEMSYNTPAILDTLQYFLQITVNPTRSEEKMDQHDPLPASNYGCLAPLLIQLRLVSGTIVDRRLPCQRVRRPSLFILFPDSLPALIGSPD